MASPRAKGREGKVIQSPNPSPVTYFLQKKYLQTSQAGNLKIHNSDGTPETMGSTVHWNTQDYGKHCALEHLRLWGALHIQSTVVPKDNVGNKNC